MKRPAAIFFYFCLVLMLGCNRISTGSVNEFNVAVKANPNILNNQSISKVRLNSSMNPHEFDGVVLENMTIRNLTLRDVQMRGARLKNVTFVDCKFIKANFDNSTFSNVKFIRGSLAGYDRSNIYDDYKTSFRRIEIDRVLFDGVYFDKSVDVSFHNGIVSLRNITTTHKEENNFCLLGGSNLHVRMDNCKVFNKQALVITGKNGSAYITNSHFSNKANVDQSTKAAYDPNLNISGKAAWIENCTLEGLMPEATILVITNSKVGSISIQAKTTGCRAFLADNTYIAKNEEGSLRIFFAQDVVYDSSYLYLYANGRIPDIMYIDAGNINIYDAEIDNLSMRQRRSDTKATSLNLLNVKIKSADWEYANVQQGNWQNVQIYPPADLKNAKFGKIIGHKVEFPQGTPWVNGTLEITNSYEPLQFDKPPVPTLEELGLAQFWKENDFPVETY